MSAPDGKGLDTDVLGVDRPLTSFVGRCSAVIHRLDDDTFRRLTHVQGPWFTSGILREAPRAGW